jgi:hypothetical protein
VKACSFLKTLLYDTMPLLRELLYYAINIELIFLAVAVLMQACQADLIGMWHANG